MKRKDVVAYLKKQLKESCKEESKRAYLQSNNNRDLSDIQVVNPISTPENSHKKPPPANNNGPHNNNKRSKDEDFDEILLDGDEDIKNRNLPLDSYNH